MYLSILLAAAVLEAGGDALVRTGLIARSGWERAAAFALGGLALFAYSLLVNTPSWTFGRLLGIYIVFFFVVAQLISWLVFAQPPSRAVLIGGAFILTGGAVLTFGHG